MGLALLSTELGRLMEDAEATKTKIRPVPRAVSTRPSTSSNTPSQPKPAAPSTPAPAAASAPKPSKVPLPGGASRCPRGFHNIDGQCRPRAVLRQAYRGLEPVAAMHREKSLHHANAAHAALRAGDHAKVAHHVAMSKRHMAAAKRTHGEWDTIGRALYPHKHNPSGHGHAGNTAPSDPNRVQSFPALTPPKSHGRLGGAAWGAGGSGPSPTGSASPASHSAPATGGPKYNPFGAKPAEPAQHPAHAPTQSMQAVPHPPPVPPGQDSPTNSLGGGPTVPMQKQPSGLHKIGHALGQGVAAATTAKAHQSGSLGWHALAHTLNHLMNSPSSGAPPQPGNTAPFGQPPSRSGDGGPHVSPYAPTGQQVQHPAPKPKRKKPAAAPGRLSF